MGVAPRAGGMRFGYIDYNWIDVMCVIETNDRMIGLNGNRDEIGRAHV